MTRRPAPSRNRAFSLVEVSIALGVATFCLLSIFGLMQSGLMSEKATVGQTVANDIVSAIYADLAATPADETTSKTYRIALDNANPDTPQTLFFQDSLEPAGAIGSNLGTEATYRATIGIKAAPSDGRAPLQARIVVTWPAVADPLASVWPSAAPGRVEVLTSLDRHH